MESLDTTASPEITTNVAAVVAVVYQGCGLVTTSTDTRDQSQIMKLFLVNLFFGVFQLYMHTYLKKFFREHTLVYSFLFLLSSLIFSKNKM